MTTVITSALLFLLLCLCSFSILATSEEAGPSLPFVLFDLLENKDVAEPDMELQSSVRFENALKAIIEAEGRLEQQEDIRHHQYAKADYGNPSVLDNENGNLSESRLSGVKRVFTHPRLRNFKRADQDESSSNKKPFYPIMYSQETLPSNAKEEFLLTNGGYRLLHRSIPNDPKKVHALRHNAPVYTHYPEVNYARPYESIAPPYHYENGQFFHPHPQDSVQQERVKNVGIHGPYNGLSHENRQSFWPLITAYGPPRESVDSNQWQPSYPHVPHPSDQAKHEFEAPRVYSPIHKDGKPAISNPEYYNNFMVERPISHYPPISYGNPENSRFNGFYPKEIQHGNKEPDPSKTEDDVQKSESVEDQQSTIPRPPEYFYNVPGYYPQGNQVFSHEPRPNITVKTEEVKVNDVPLLLSPPTQSGYAHPGYVPLRHPYSFNQDQSPRNSGNRTPLFPYSLPSRENGTRNGDFHFRDTSSPVHLPFPYPGRFNFAPYGSFTNTSSRNLTFPGDFYGSIPRPVDSRDQIALRDLFRLGKTDSRIDIPPMMPACAKKSNATICFEDEEYPEYDVRYALSADRLTLQRFLDTSQTSAELNEDKKTNSDNEDDTGDICKVDIHQGRPLRAQDVDGHWKTVVNVPRTPRSAGHMQTVRLESCRNKNSACSYTENVKTKCVQKETFHRLLVLDNVRGLHMSLFKLPVACTCQLIKKQDVAT